MFLDITPLKKYPNYRWLYTGQFFSAFGSMISYVAIPYQVYQLTENSMIVGLLGAAQFLPMVLFSLLGGTFADRLDRKKMMLICEAGMGIALFLLMLNAWRSSPSVMAIFVLVIVLQSLTGFHRPAMEAISQMLVAREDFTAMSALGSLKHSAAAIIGPSLGGVLIAGMGIQYVYLIDALTFLIAIYCIIKNVTYSSSRKI
ncbi:MAG: MFS transporter [Bdellovibrionota bacterium]